MGWVGLGGFVNLLTCTQPNAPTPKNRTNLIDWVKLG